MKLKLRTKAIIVIAVFAAIVGIACGVRAYIDATEAEKARVEAEQAAAVEVDTGDFAVSTLDSEVIGMLGGEAAAEELAKKVGAWCMDNVDNVSEATWDGKVVKDYKAHAVDVTYTLDDKARTRIQVRIWPDTGRYVVTKAVS